MEKKLCEYCGKEETYDIFPVCEKCLKITMQWGDNAQKNRLRYYFNKKEMEKNPELKQQKAQKRRAITKRYMQTHKEQWNAYQREYKRRKQEQARKAIAENKAIREELAQLKKQLSMTGVDK